MSYENFNFIYCIAPIIYMYKYVYTSSLADQILKLIYDFHTA